MDGGVRLKIHDLSICLIIRDEGDYLQEWLDWHVNAGVEHFYIYDNGSRPPITEFVPEQYRDYCTVLQAPEMFQVEAYTHCLSHYRQDSHWIAFIDTDEFIRIEDGRSIPEFLRNMPSEADAVALHWVVYGANGQRKKSNASVRERFLTPVDTYPNLPQTKCIVRPERISGMFPHWPIDIHEPVRVVNTHGEPVNWCMSKKITKDIAVVDHYFTRSLEEWNEKIARGSCDPQYMRPDAMFYIINPDMRDSE